MTDLDLDTYQQRYLAHQAKKRDVLTALLDERHSERRFADTPLDGPAIHDLTRAVTTAPSSCDRQAVKCLVVTDRDTKALLGGLLVGGVGWVHRAPTVLMLFADPTAYKAPGEAEVMPYLDAGAIVGQLGLAAAGLGLVGCFINPNVRPDHRPLFTATFGHRIYCGAYAVGHPRQP
jgi:nitroreductase